MTDRALENFLLRVRNDRGLDLTGYKDSFLLRRLRSRFRVLEIDNLDEYCYLLEKNPAEYAKLIDVLAINVTEFFRDPSLWNLLSNRIIPDLLEARKESRARTIRFLSAGGASGEEAYSIAISMCEALEGKSGDFSASVMLVDIDPDCILKAKAGIYHEDRLTNVPPHLLAKYFTREGPERYRVKPELRKMLTMSNLDLLTGRIPKFFDVIFCRNLLIYFTRDAHSDLFSKLYSSLLLDGFLILGRTETLLGASKTLFDTYDSRERVYRRKGIAYHSSTNKC